MRYSSTHVFLPLLLFFVAILCLGCGEVSGETPSDMTIASPDGNLIRNGDFSEGFEGWDKFHSSNVKDKWDLLIDDERPCVYWSRTNSRNDGGSVGVVQSMDVDATGFEKLSLSLDVMVKDHSLRNPGWWSEARGGSGEYPAKIILFYEDAGGKRQMWTHGFITAVEKQPVVYKDPKTGKEEHHDEETTVSNFTIVPRDEWYHYEVDIMDESQLVEMDLGQRGGRMPRPHRIIMIRLVGEGWDFAAAIDNIRLHGE